MRYDTGYIKLEHNLRVKADIRNPLRYLLITE